MARRVPEGPPPPPVAARYRVRYAKRGRLRFTSHRDFARAFERALRRAGVPMAYSAGFTPHPKISYVGACPTGVASEAEYLELGLAEPVEPERLRETLDSALPPGLDVVEVVPAGPGSLADRMAASRWRVELPGVEAAELRAAVGALLARDEVLVERMTKAGRREVDVRAALVSAEVDDVHDAPDGAADPAGPDSDGVRAIMTMVVRLVTPVVRPDDVLAALGAVAGLALVAPPVAVREAQGPLDDAGAIGDPLVADRTTA